MRALTRALLLALCLTLLATACASSEDGAGDETTSEAPADDASEGPDAEPAGPSEPVEDEPSDDGAADGAADADAAQVEVSPVGTSGVEVTGPQDAEPEIALPDAEPPTELIVEDLVEGEGDVIEPGAQVTTHYVGVSWTNDGEEFDSSWDRGAPATFGLDQVIAGWTEGIPGMRVGGRRLLVIPPDMAYGEQSPSPAIAANDTLVFVIDMVGPPEPIEPGTDQMGVEVSGDLGSKPEITVPGGEPPAELVVVDLVEGDGAVAETSSTVSTQYVGVAWSDGEQFDASWDNGGEPISFPLSGVIPGWTQGIPGMAVGGRRLLIIPPDLAYGENPPPGAPFGPGETLVFVIDLTDVQ